MFGIKSKVGLFEVLIACSALLLGLLYREQTRLSEEMAIQQSHLNNTPKADETGLIFNRVPKVGSETIWSLIDKLAKVNGFNSFSDNGELKLARRSENTYLTTKEERLYYIDMLETHENVTRPFSYVKHINFLDFTEFNYTNPVYVNFVRHPVDRVISWYYYIRTPWYNLKFDKFQNKTYLDNRVMPLQYLKTPIEECVLQRNPECIYDKGQLVHASRHGGSHFSQIAFFCGHEPICDVFHSDAALEKAKFNVENYFSVVGVLEQVQKSLEVFEHYVPFYFRNARKVYKDMMNESHNNKNMYKPKTPTYIREMLMANFSKEIDFYEFCRQRLYKQYLTIL